MKLGWLGAMSLVLLTGCGGYRDFQLPPRGGPLQPVHLEWIAQPAGRAAPVLSPGGSGAWDGVDVLNPSVIRSQGGLLNLYSGFDGKTWRTGIATSADGIHWSKRGPPILSPPAGGYIAANGSVVQFQGSLRYYYQGGRTPRIYQSRPEPDSKWSVPEDPVLDVGPYGSWDERGVADPYVIAADGNLYLYYLGMDRARRQRLGVAMSHDGTTWGKLPNPILELGQYGAFDENGLGEPAVWASPDGYRMLYTGRARNEQRRLGLARSQDGVHWEKLAFQIQGDQAWDSRVMCDPSVLAEGGQVHVWFGGGDVARPDENIHGQIGYGILKIVK